MQMRHPLALLLLGAALALASPTGASTTQQLESAQTTAKPAPQSANPAPSRNRHQRRHTNSKRQTHRHKSGVKK